jgi:hypothetical protein
LFGAKVIGESGLLSGALVIINAISDAPGANLIYLLRRKRKSAGPFETQWRMVPLH